MKILIVEDDRVLADSLKALLAQKGFQAEAVYDGESGEAYAQLGIYDLLILDVMMPGLDGYELARVWGFDSNATENHVEVYVGFLRKKLASIGSDIRIVAIRRLGYHLEVGEPC